MSPVRSQDSMVREHCWQHCPRRDSIPLVHPRGTLTTTIPRPPSHHSLLLMLFYVVVRKIPSRLGIQTVNAACSA
nr:hypothetical protein CFP56_64605 [Quercus suber]